MIMYRNGNIKMVIQEKESLLPLPKQVIRDSYRVEHPKAKVLHDNIISFQGNLYSVPPGRRLTASSCPSD